MSRSLQSRLMLWIGLSIATVLIAAGIVLYYLLQNALLAEFDNGLRETCHSVAHLIETDGQRIKSEMAEKELPRFSRNEQPDLYQVFDVNGRPVESSSGLGERSLPFIETQLGETRFEFASLPDGRPGRLVALTFVPQMESDSDDNEEGEREEREHGESDRTDKNNRAVNLNMATLVIARDTLEINRALARIRWLIGLVTAFAIVIGVFLAALVAKFGLSSLRNTAAQIAAIDGGNLDVEFESGEMPAEIQPMISALNDMQGRLKRAFEQERQFSANVAHELRTPLAGMKGMLEVTTSRKRTPEEYEESIGKCVAVCDQTEAIVDNLFTLASVDAGQCQIESEWVELSHLIRTTWKPLAKLGESNKLKVEWDLDDSIQLKTDSLKLGLILRNLFENAVSYADPTTVIEIKCRDGASNNRSKISNPIEIVVVNSASDLDESSLLSLFERFWRGDKSRSQTGRHSGLGLALSRSLVHLLGGTIQAQMSDGNRLSICLRLPVESN